MTRATALVLALVPALATGAGEPASPAEARPSIETLGRGVADLEARLLRLAVRAGEDPRITRIERYLVGLDLPAKRGAKRETTAKDLVAFVADASAPLAVRERARDALQDPKARFHDPDLTAGKGGRRSPFSREALVPLLAAKDVVSRRCASEVLATLWMPPDAEIRAYDPNQPATWKPAQSAWARHLRDK